MSMRRQMRWIRLVAAVPLLAAAVPLLAAAKAPTGKRSADPVLDPARCAAIMRPISLSLPFFVQSGQSMSDRARAALKPGDDRFRIPPAAHDAGELLLDETRPKVTLAETQRACALFQQAVRGGIIDANVPLGQLIRDTADTQANRDLARAAWQRAAAKDQPFAKLWLAVLDARTPGADAAKRRAAAAELARLSGIGFAPASLWLGNAAFEGWSGPPSIVEARRLLEVAARGGIPEAANALGNLLRNGAPGLEPDLPQSEYWFGMAFQMGWRGAAADAGIAAASPRNPQRDEARARAWFEKGVAADNAAAKAALASVLAFGNPAKRDPKRAYALASEAAAADSPAGTYLAAILLRTGTGVAANPKQAQVLQRRALDLGSADAQIDLGRRQLTGDGVPRDPKAGLALIEKAAKQNVTEAICLRGTAELTLEMSPAAALRAEPWLVEGARRESPACLTMLGTVISRGWYKDFTDPLVGVSLMVRGAAAGDRDAQFALGTMYQQSVLVARDVPRARRYFELAAAQGHPGALESLGRMQIVGTGGTANLLAGRAALEKALALGSADAAMSLAALADAGQGEPRDRARALRLFQRAGELGKAEGWASAGDIVNAGGGGVAPAPGPALLLWRKAYAAGYTPAAAHIASALIDGRGTRAKPAAGVDLLREAAAKGDAGAINNLGSLYQNGSAGLRADAAAAEGWYRKAAPGNAVALINLGYLVSNLPDRHDYVVALAYLDAALKGQLQGLPPQSLTDIQARVAELRRVLPADAQARAFGLSADVVQGRLPPPFFTAAAR